MEEQVPAQEKEAEEKEKKDVEPEKEKEMETQQEDNKEDSDFEVIPEVSEKTGIYPTLPSEEQTRLWKNNNEKEDKVEAALKTMQAMGFSDDGGWLSSLL